MPQLSAAVKRHIVIALAGCETPTDVCRSVKETFGIDITRQRVSRYDPTTSASDLSAPLRALFYEARTAHLKDIRQIPIAHQAYRLRALQKELHKAEELGNVPMVLTILEIAAKEVGGMYTGRREVTGPGGKAIAHQMMGVSPAVLAATVRAVRNGG